MGQLQVWVFGVSRARFLEGETESEQSGNLSHSLTPEPKCPPEGRGSASFTRPSSLHPPALPEPPRRDCTPDEAQAVGRRTARPHGDHGLTHQHALRRRLCWRLDGEADGPGLGGCGHLSREQLVGPGGLCVGQASGWKGDTLEGKRKDRGRVSTATSGAWRGHSASSWDAVGAASSFLSVLTQCPQTHHGNDWDERLT